MSCRCRLIESRAGSADFGQDVLDLGDAGEHVRAGVGVGQVLLDRGDQFPHVPEDAAPEPPGGEVTEPALDGSEPRTARENTVPVEARMAPQPASHRRMLLGGVVVHDEMEWPIRQGLLAQPLQEPQPFLVAMPRRTGTDALSREHIEGRKERSGAMPVVGMGPGPAPRLLQREAGLSPIQGLDLTVLVCTEDQVSAVMQ